LWIIIDGQKIEFFPFRLKFGDPVNNNTSCVKDTCRLYTYSYSDGNEHFGVFWNSIISPRVFLSLYNILFYFLSIYLLSPFHKNTMVSNMTSRYPKIYTKYSTIKSFYSHHYIQKSNDLYANTQAYKMHNVGSEMNKMYFIFVYCILLLLFFLIIIWFEDNTIETFWITSALRGLLIIMIKKYSILYQICIIKRIHQPKHTNPLFKVKTYKCWTRNSIPLNYVTVSLSVSNITG